MGILTFGDYDGSYNLTDPQSFNRYSYPQNDPVNFVDPSGLDDDPPEGWPDDLVTTEWIYTSAPYWPGSGFGGGEMGLLERRPVGGNPLITVPSSTPTPTPQKPKSPVEQAFDKARAACLARKKAEADKARSEYRNKYSSRLFWSMGTGALVGAVRGGYVGAIGGEFLEPLGGGVPGAAVGVVVGGIFGAAGGVLTSVVKEPIYRAAYDHFTYNRAINYSYIDCDAEARTAVATAQVGGRR